jgi:outer membrane protein assembly factor BamB
MLRFELPALCLPALLLSPCFAEPQNGWRGNGTGLWPDARPPLEWNRKPLGVLTDLRTCADRPGAKVQADLLPLAKGIIREWLVLGPFAMKDSVQDFDSAPLTDEAGAQPAEGNKVGDLTWNKLAAELDDPFAFGPAVAPFTNLAAAVGGFKQNQAAYVHTYLYVPRGGTVHAVVEHGHGMKAWLNGKVAYRAPARAGGMGNYYASSRVEWGTWDLVPSPRFSLDLSPGWNRLLLKVTTYNKKGWTDQGFLLRLLDLPNIPYESKNILWMAELPQRSNATPIVAGNRVLVMAEPDELICLDKGTGRILWTAANNYYEALTPDERRANPAFRARVDPLVAAIRQEKDFIKRQQLRTQLQKTLVAIDAARFRWKANDHFEAHFGIVGFTTPTPVSDGKHVWVWCGNGVAACYDLAGKRRWITRVPVKELSYTSSPALADGILAVSTGERLVGLEAATGRVRWQQDEVRGTNGSVLAARIAGLPVFVSDRTLVRAGDGHVLFTEPTPGGTWTAGVVRGDVLYAPGYGVNQLQVLDFTGARGDTWQPKRQTLRARQTGRLPNGQTADRSTAASPLVVGGLAYLVDIYAAFYAYDLQAGSFLYQKDTGMRGLFHYCAVPVTASPALLGKHIVIQNNQGTALVLDPGRAYREARQNQIATQLDRYWPVPAQETLSYAPPVPDGDRLYIRGERYLYCIGAKSGP